MKRKECDKLFGPDRRRPLFPVCASVIICLVLGIVRPADAGSLRLVERTTVTGPQVTLADIAELDGFYDLDQATELSAKALFEAPAPGTRRVLQLAEVREALYAQGVNLAEVLLVGSTHVEIIRPSDPVPAVTPESHTTGGEASSDGAGTLESLIRAHIQQRFAEYGGKVDVQFSRTEAANRALSLTTDQYEFRIVPMPARKLGLTSHAVEVAKDGGKLQTLHILANVSLVRSVVAAARPINRGRTVEPDDVRLRERRFVRLEQIGETDLARIVGQQARRFIERGELITVRDVKPVPLVRRNELVTVWNRTGSVAVRTVGKALGTGGLGDEIEVKSERSGRRYPARITGVRTVEAVGKGSGARAAMR